MPRRIRCSSCGFSATEAATSSVILPSRTSWASAVSESRPVFGSERPMRSDNSVSLPSAMYLRTAPTLVKYSAASATPACAPGKSRWQRTPSN